METGQCIGSESRQVKRYDGQTQKGISWLTVGISSKWEMNLVHLRVDRGLIERADKEVHIMFKEAWNLILTVLLKRPQRDVSTLGLPSILPCGVQS